MFYTRHIRTSYCNVFRRTYVAIFREVAKVRKKQKLSSIKLKYKFQSEIRCVV